MLTKLYVLFKPPVVLQFGFKALPNQTSSVCVCVCACVTYRDDRSLNLGGKLCYMCSSDILCAIPDNCRQVSFRPSLNISPLHMTNRDSLPFLFARLFVRFCLMGLFFFLDNDWDIPLPLWHLLTAEVTRKPLTLLPLRLSQKKIADAAHLLVWNSIQEKNSVADVCICQKTELQVSKYNILSYY